MAGGWQLRHLIETVADHSYRAAGSTHGGVRHREVDRPHIPDSHPECVDAMPIEGGRSTRCSGSSMARLPLTTACARWLLAVEGIHLKRHTYMYGALSRGCRRRVRPPLWEIEPRRQRAYGFRRPLSSDGRICYRLILLAAYGCGLGCSQWTKHSTLVMQTTSSVVPSP